MHLIYSPEILLGVRVRFREGVNFITYVNLDNFRVMFTLPHIASVYKPSVVGRAFDRCVEGSIPVGETQGFLCSMVVTN